MDRRHPDETASLVAEEWETVKELVFACQSLDADAQRRWLDEHAPSPKVRAEVERLLLSSQQSSSFLEQSAPQRLGLVDAQLLTHVAHFRILHQLGAGGMGIVYAAVDERLGRQVALKVLHSDKGATDEQRRRLLWDARAASVLTHPNIVCVYEAGEAQGIEYVAMEFVTGRTLADILATDPPPQTRLLGYAVQIAAALEAAHAVGIVHRDVKPRNVMITETGTAKLVDFGLAKNPAGRLSGASSAPETIEGQLAGTVAYMSPEQAEGGDIDFRSDIFSFGSVLYEMLTRRRAFAGGSSVSVLARIIHTNPEPVHDIRGHLDPRLEDIINRCLRKDRERRFQSMADIKVRLQEILDGDGSAPVPVRAVPDRKRKRELIVAGVVAAAVLTTLGAYSRLKPRIVVPDVTVPSRLTWDGGLTTWPAISSDGTLVAYSSDRAGRGDLDIWVQRAAGSDPIPLTFDAADESRPTFSPDGTQVAYRSERSGGGVYVVPALGGTERLLVPGGRDPQYSPDGRSIACWIGEVGGAFYAGAGKIVIVPATGGPARPFRTDFEATAFPLWTPDGKALVFLGRKATPGGPAPSVIDWWIAPEGSGNAQPTGTRQAFLDAELTPPDGFYWIRPEAWLDARQILFTATKKDATNIWSIELDPRGTSPGRPRPLTQAAAAHAFPAMASLGERQSLYFASLVFDVQLWRLPLSTDARRDEAPRRIMPNLSHLGSPSISTDGRVLIYTIRQANAYRLVSVDVATGEQATAATVESEGFVRTVISGDGKSLLYLSNRVGYRMAVVHGVPEPICKECGWPTHLNADGTEGLFESSGSEEQLLIWAGGTVRPLIAPGSDPQRRMQFGGRFSPDGKLVAFCAGVRGSPQRQIMVVPKAPNRTLGPDEWIAITDGTTSDREPFWAQDGSRIYFLSDREGFRCIWARPVDRQTGRPTGPPYPVVHFHHARELLRGGASPAVGAIGLSASTDSLIFTVAKSTGNIWWQTLPAVR